MAKDDMNDSLGQQSVDRTPLEAQAHLAAIVASSDDAIVSKTLDGVVTSWNEGARRIFGYAAEEIVGRPITVIIPKERLDEEPRILARLRAGERVDHFETVRQTKDGRLIDVSVTISPVRDSTGRIVGASKIARDITMQRQVQRELIAAKEAAESASRAKDHFLSVLSHELRTPLTPVLAAMSFLETRAHELPEEMRDQIGMVRRNVETEARLVDDLLDVTRISRGKVRLHFESVDLHEALRSAVGMWQAEFAAKELKVTLMPRATRHHVWADPGRLQQVFLNLLSNAVKFTPDGGTIVVRTSDLRPRAGSDGVGEDDETDNWVRVQVIDTGMGIEAGLLERLFRPFEQGERTGGFAGLGLGLSIARSLTEMHGGTIAADSKGPGRGATFTVDLATMQPAEQPAAASGEAPAPGSPESPAGAPCRILLVEDHVDTRVVMERLLRNCGFQVSSAGTVAEALSMADRQEFDVLISDIGLPDGSGTEVIRHLRQRRPIRGIALSGY